MVNPASVEISSKTSRTEAELDQPTRRGRIARMRARKTRMGACAISWEK